MRHGKRPVAPWRLWCLISLDLSSLLLWASVAHLPPSQGTGESPACVGIRRCTHGMSSAGAWLGLPDGESLLHQQAQRPSCAPRAWGSRSHGTSVKPGFDHEESMAWTIPNMVNVLPGEFWASSMT